MEKLAGKTVALDFDGVLHSYTSGWTGYEPTDPPVPGAKEAVEALLAAGAEVVVFSTRADTQEGAEATAAWLAQYGFPEVQVTAMKPKAVAYIDDRAVSFRGDWDDALAQANELVELHDRPWRPKPIPILEDEPEPEVGACIPCSEGEHGSVVDGRCVCCSVEVAS